MENINRVAVIGAGLMGFGVATEFARFGYQVSIYNTREETSRQAMEQIGEALDLMAETERVVATHYFQPPHFVPLVEVVGGSQTDPGVVEQTARLLRSMRKKVVVIDVELPLFVGNRIQQAIAREIQSLVDQGVCSPEMIDDIISFGFGRRMAYTGHFKRMDLIGLDLGYTAVKDRGLEPWKPIAERVERGELGMKTGKGFYEWPGDTAKQLHRRLNTELIRLMKHEMETGVI